MFFTQLEQSDLCDVLFIQCPVQVLNFFIPLSLSRHPGKYFTTEVLKVLAQCKHQQQKHMEYMLVFKGTV